MAEFRIKRCLGLIRMQTMENWKIFVLSLGIVAVINFSFSIVQADGSLYSRFYPVILCLTGCLMAATGYRSWTQPGRSAFFLLLPASSCEKFTSVLAYCTLIFIPVFTVFYFFTGYFFLNLYHPVSFYEMVSGGKNSMLNYRQYYEDTFLVYFLILPAFLTGAARFRNYQFLFTLLILALLFVAYNYWQLFLLYNFSGGLAFGHTFFIKYGDFTWYHFPEHGYISNTVDLVLSLRYWNILAWIVIGSGLYLVAYNSLKERKI